MLYPCEYEISSNNKHIDTIHACSLMSIRFSQVYQARRNICIMRFNTLQFNLNIIK